MVEVVAKGVSFTPQSPGTSGIPRTTKWHQIERAYAWKRAHPDTPLRPADLGKHGTNVSPRNSSYVVALLYAIDEHP
jgi:hypothetical protein